MAINPTQSLGYNFATPVGQGVSAQRTTQTGPVEKFERTQAPAGLQDPRQAMNGQGVKSPKYPPQNSQFRHGNAQANINGASNAGGYLAGLSAAQLHYPDGRWNLQALADASLKSRGLATEYPQAVLDQVAAIKGPAAPNGDPSIRDLRDMKFSSIDNPTSQDLDQLEWAQKLPNGDIKVMVAVTDVGALVPKGSPLDEFTKQNGESIYTPDKVYNLLPEKLACDLISLNGGQDRVAMVTEMVVAPDGSVKSEDIYRGYVHNYAKMDYPTVGKWLAEGAKPDQAPGPMAAAGPEMLEQVKVQNEAAERLKNFRHSQGALSFANGEVNLNVKDHSVVGTTASEKNAATELVENFMVSANGAMSRFLRKHNFPSIQRVVKQPEKWDQIQDLAATMGYKLPDKPDGKALEGMLEAEQAKNPDKFADLSGQVIRMIGKGEFEAAAPGEAPEGHFGLGVSDYAQQTASMRRRGDRINIDLVKDCLAGRPPSYSMDELRQEAANLTDKESAIKKAEREINKTAVATMLESRIGEEFAATVTGSNNKGAWCTIDQPHVEAKLGNGKGHGLKVGDHVKGKLTSVNVEKGHIDFSLV